MLLWLRIHCMRWLHQITFISVKGIFLRFLRGLFALTLIFFLFTPVQAQYLYKDEVVKNPDFTKQIEELGAELYQKTGISLRLIMVRSLPQDRSIVDYEKSLIKDFDEATILLTFAELDMKVDILAIYKRGK